MYESGGKFGFNSECSQISWKDLSMQWEAALHRRLSPNPQSLRARSVTWQENFTAVVKDLADGKFVLNLPVGPRVIVIVGVLTKARLEGPTQKRSHDDSTEDRSDARKGPRAKECRQPPVSSKSQENRATQAGREGLCQDSAD